MEIKTQARQHLAVLADAVHRRRAAVAAVAHESNTKSIENISEASAFFSGFSMLV